MIPLEESTLGIVFLDDDQKKFFFSLDGTKTFFEVLVERRQELGHDLVVPLDRVIKTPEYDNETKVKTGERVRTDRRVLEITEETTVEDVSIQYYQKLVANKFSSELLGRALTLIGSHLNRGGYRPMVLANKQIYETLLGRKLQIVLLNKPEKLQPLPAGESYSTPTPLPTRKRTSAATQTAPTAANALVA